LFNARCAAIKGGGGLRPSWDRYFLEIAGVVAERSTCLRRKVGAVLVKDKRILTTGYNGAPGWFNALQGKGVFKNGEECPFWGTP
jgi:dCMP deaminase